MPTTKVLLTYLVMLVVFLAIDFLWLGLLAKGIYAKYLGNFFRERFLWTPALIFYALFILGVLIFVTLPGVENGSLGRTFLLGGLFGLVTYATYDLTNYATLKDWPLQIVLIDLCWGFLVSGIVATSGFLAGTRLS